MLDRTIPPAFNKTTLFPLIQPDQTVLSNGLEITFVQGGDQEVVKVEFIFRAGKWYEVQAGVSYFTTYLLQKGTTSKSSYHIASAFDQLGVHLEINPGNDFCSIAIYGLTRNIEKLFDVTKDILINAVFPEEEVQQAKAIYIQGLKINLEKTSYLASKQLRQNIFGATHPYGRDASITQIEAIEREGLVSFHRSAFNDVQLICSGKISLPLRNAIEKSFCSLPVSKTLLQPTNKSEFGPVKQVIEKEKTVQSSIRLGKKIINRKHRNYPGLLLLNHIFGGYFGSRLMKNIREEKGLTYGIYSSVSSFVHDSYISIGADVNQENRELTIEEIKKEMLALRSIPVSRQEFETARNHFIGSVQSEITTPFAHADKIKNILLNTLPADYYQSLLNTVDQVTPEILQAIAQQYLADESFFEVTVG